ncbi:uncharacterized protein KY384_003471 [Bacidia gigantensis]|uniref:uncharacterized protein n=1 Tax=Bacidia gigantensis TaxID=2732470 RepID=UPI001D043F67|nr:uncharacterized protein KY384_003471 [Bacidia gigantensis]KAG8531835.1 hypothetical protein KY384_003471 [Bacidia gigantensis]
MGPSRSRSRRATRCDGNTARGAELSFNSPPFRFIVDGESFYIHQSIISRVSDPLNALMTLDMKEKRDGEATLLGVDATTFDSFCQWAYNGSYNPAESVVRVIEPTTPTENGGSGLSHSRKVANALASAEARPLSEKESKDEFFWANDFFGSFDFDGHQVNSKMSRAHMRSRFIKLRDIKSLTHMPQRNSSLDEDFTDVFLSHARLYVFAGEKLIYDLSKYVLGQLHAILASFTLYGCRTGDIVALLKYVYENTVRDGQDHDRGLGHECAYTARNELRNMLTDYIGWQLETLMLDEEFRSLPFTMESNGPEFHEDFLHVVMRRL